jgi:hypothetical protein
MKTQKMYSSREEFEAKNNIVVVELPTYQGKKCGIAQIVCSYRTRKQAENTISYQGEIMTRKQAEKIIPRWNSEYENNNLSINF